MLYTYVLNGGTKLTMQTKGKIETILNKSSSTAMEDTVTVFFSSLCNFFYTVDPVN